MYNHAYELIVDYMTTIATPEDVAEVSPALFDLFHKRAKSTTLTSSTMECLIRFCCKKEHSSIILELYDKNPDSFNLGQTYNLIEMLIGYNYGDSSAEDRISALIEAVKQKDHTDTFDNNLKKYAAVRLSPEQRLVQLKEFMLNESNKYSAGEVGFFAQGFTSRFLPREVKRQYYETFFDNLLPALKKNSNMYSKVTAN